MKRIILLVVLVLATIFVSSCEEDEFLGLGTDSIGTRDPVDGDTIVDCGSDTTVGDTITMPDTMDYQALADFMEACNYYPYDEDGNCLLRNTRIDQSDFNSLVARRAGVPPLLRGLDVYDSLMFGYYGKVKTEITFSEYAYCRYSLKTTFEQVLNSIMPNHYENPVDTLCRRIPVKCQTHSTGVAISHYGLKAYFSLGGCYLYGICFKGYYKEIFVNNDILSKFCVASFQKDGYTFLLFDEMFCSWQDISLEILAGIARNSEFYGVPGEM